jgi:hypothetical protein
MAAVGPELAPIAGATARGPDPAANDETIRPRLFHLKHEMGAILVNQPRFTRHPVVVDPQPIAHADHLDLAFLVV